MDEEDDAKELKPVRELRFRGET